MPSLAIRASLALLAGLAASLPAYGQSPSFPAKPVRLIVPTASGGMSDVVARLYGDAMAKVLKQPVLVENMPGAQTLLGIRHVVKSPADGYTLSVSANTLVTMPYVDKRAGYQPSDVTGVSYLAKSPMALVVGSESPYRTLADLVRAAKAAPGTLTFASVGIGTTSHLPVELFAQSAGIKLEMVPYKGIPLAIPDVTTGRVTLMMGTSSSVGEMIKSGRMRALAITSEARSPSFPGVPTFAELGYGEATYELIMGLVAPAGTPAAVIEVLAQAAEAAKQEPHVRKRLDELGQELPTQTTPQQFQDFLRREEAKMRKVVSEANIRSE